MKKSLFAVAVATAFAGAAQAQSSVTVYGNLDAAIGQATQKNTTAGATVTTTQRTTANGDGALSTSLFGLRGTEDLGRGMSASFVLEYDLTDIGSGGTGSNVDSTTAADAAIGASTGNSNTAGGFGARQSWLGIRDNSLGELRIGRQFSVMHAAYMNGAAGAGNNVAGAVYSAGTNGFVNSAGVRPYDVFINRAITYMAPTTAGVSIALQTSTQYASSAETAAATANSFVGGSLTYTGVKNLTASYAYARVGINGTAVTSGDTNTATHILAANYNFGPVQPFANWSQRSIDRANGDNQAKTSAMEIGLRAPITPTLGVWASGFQGARTSGLTNAATTTTALGSGSADLKGYQIGATYGFSKRTTAYAIYGTQEVKGKNAQANTKIETDHVAIGLRHTF